MTDTTVIETEPDFATAQLPQEPVSPAPADSWDEVQAALDEFDQKTRQPEQNQDSPEQSGDAASNDELDKLLADLSGPSPDQQRITALEGEIGSLHAAELERQSRVDFEGFSKKLQAECGNNVDESFARTNLLAALAERPELGIVWQHRHVTDEQLRAAELEFQQLEVLHMRAQQAPDDPRKQQAIAALEQRGYQLGLMLNSRKILNDVWRDVQKRAEKVKPPIDVEATADRAAVAFHVRQAHSGDIPEAPVRWGQLSGKDFRAKVIKDHGFDPGAF